MRLTPNPEQQAAASHPSSLAVTASAGTGKTAMLVERYLHHLLAGGLRPLQVVAATFTEKAAGELRERVRKRLREELGSADPRLAELDAAPIGTLHSLAARICREHPEAAEVAPGFVILDETEAPIWSRQRVDELLTRLPPERFTGLRWSLARAAVHRLLDEPFVAAQALVRVTRPWADVRAEWEAWAAAEREAGLAELTAPPWDEAVGFLRSVRGASDDGAEIARQTILDGVELFEAGELRPGLELMASADLRYGRKAAWRCDLAEVKAALKLLCERARKARKEGRATAEVTDLDEHHHSLLQRLRGLFETVGGGLSELKRQAGLLGYADLETGALLALGREDVRRWYAERWQAILVDEAQDVNPTQAELLRRLRDLEPAPTLTAVGDVKQSIYGFRHARPEEFASLGRELGAPHRLSHTYRQHRPLAETLNALFAPVLGEQHAPVESEREPPHPGRYVELAVVAEKASAATGRQAEAAYLAARLTQWLGRLPVHDRRDDRVRPLEPRDVAVLSRAWQPLDLFADAFAAAGIPVVHHGGGSLLATREALDGIALLRTLCDPGDRLALAAVLRGPMCAVDDVTLDDLARPGDQPWPKRLDGIAAAAWLAELRKMARCEPPSRLLERADELTGYSAVLANLPLAERRLADWRGFIAAVREAERGHLDLFAIVRWLRQLLEAGVELPRPSLEAHDAVSLATIHFAKGLEWPVVIVPDLSRQSRGNDPRVRLDAARGVALDLPLPDDQPQPFLTWLMKENDKRRAADELKRLAYVALTRARDRLLLTAGRTSGGSSLLELLAEPLAAAGVTADAIPFDPAAPLPEPTVKPTTGPAPEAVLLERLQTGLDEVVASALDLYERCPRRFWYDQVEGHPGLPVDGEGGEARRIGILVHHALEHGLRSGAELRLQDAAISDDGLQHALALLARWDQHSAFAAVREAAAEPEVEQVGELHGVRLTARIDRLAGEFVLDYKTGQTAVAETHDLQLWAYARLSGRPAAYVADLETPRLLALDPARVDALEARAEAVLSGIRQGEFEARPGEATCRVCPYSAVCPAAV